MHLSPEEIAAAEACGVSFLPASDAHVQRLAMQRKIFYRNGAPILATRGDGFFETVGTLQQLIEEGHRQQRDLAQWLQAAEPPQAVEPPAVPDGEPAAAADLVPASTVLAESAEPTARVAEPMAPKPPRPRRKRPAAVASRTADAVEDVPEDLSVAAPPPAAQPLPAARAAPRPTGTPAQERGKRWLMAGAERRGRADKHWSTRQR